MFYERDRLRRAPTTSPGKRSTSSCSPVNGLVPFWAKDPKVGSRMINARVETVAEKPAYRRALAARRCLLPADGYYEWLPPEEPGGRKQPVYLSRVDGQPLALAGLWETWTSPHGQRLDSCVVLTTTAVDELGHVHDRAPVVVDKPDWAAWLNPGLRDPEQVRALLARLGPLPAAATAAWPVSMDVNLVRNNGPGCASPCPSRPELRGEASTPRETSGRVAGWVARGRSGGEAAPPLASSRPVLPCGHAGRICWAGRQWE